MVKNKKITVGVFIKVDDIGTEDRIRKIVNETITQITSDIKEVSIRLYPINYILQKSKLQSFYSKKTHVLDAIIFAEISSGNFKNGKDNSIENIIEIKEITFLGNFNANENLKIFETNINLARDLKLRNVNKNWAYIESQSYQDKNKLKINFKDTILFYCGLYLIYDDKIESALKILKELHVPNLGQIRVDKKAKIFYGNRDTLPAARLNSILLNLFSLYISRSYVIENNKDKAYSALKECEKIFGKHPQSFIHYLVLARISYENNKDISEALYYTDLAKSIRPNSTETFLNYGFFAILRQDVKGVLKYYKELAHSYLHHSYLNYIDTIYFLEREKNSFSSDTALFDFAIGTINYVYGDKILGKKDLLDFKLKNQNNPVYEEIIHFVNQLLTKGPFKPIYSRKNTKQKSKKRK